MDKNITSATIVRHVQKVEAIEQAESEDKE